MPKETDFSCQSFSSVWLKERHCTDTACTCLLETPRNAHTCFPIHPGKYSYPYIHIVENYCATITNMNLIKGIMEVAVA